MVTLARDTGRPGPRMRALRPRQREFVRQICLLGGNARKNSQAARNAGYTGDDTTIGVTAHRLMHDPKVIEAIKEEADRRLQGAQLLAVSTLIEIAGDDLAKDRLKAAVAILDRTGAHAKSEHTVNVHDDRSTQELIAAGRALAAQLGIDPVKLLGQSVLDAEFAEVVTGAEGLEDLL